MKTKLLLALSAFVAFLATSCNISENITIGEDGSGVMTMDIDASQLMGMAGGQMGKEGRIDSTFTFKELYKEKADSIAKLPAAEREKFKQLEKIEGKMLMDPETGEFMINFTNKFKNANELGNMMQAMSAVSKSQMQEGAPDMESQNPPTSYFYDGKKFKKTVKVSDKANEVENDSLQMIKAMFEGSTYTVNYKFPKKIKSVSNKNAVISADKKTVTVVYDLVDYMDKPKDMDIEVIFE
ncbi:MAG: hypothetical protein V4581_02485 [Bacteroidota bacterium]